MKNFLKVLLVFVMIFVITGCGKKEEVKERKPIEVLSDTIKNEKSVNEIKIDMSFNVKASAEGVSVDSNINAIVSALKDENNTKVVFELSDNPLVGAFKGYANLTDTKIVTYIPSKVYNMINYIDNDNNIYIKSEDDIDTNDESYKEVMDYLKGLDLNTILTDKDFYLINKTNNKGMYRLVISKELLDRMAKSIDPKMKSDFDDFKGSINLNITIDEKNNRITEVSCDLIDFIKANVDSLNLGKDVNIDEIIQKLSFNFKFQYAAVDATIPEDVINNSMSEKEYIARYGNVES